jgi:hypothetical protein
MKINGIEGMSVANIQSEITKGGKFVVFQYCISIVLFTFKRASDIYFIKSEGSTFGVSIGYTLTTLLLGWWGIPWGPIYTIGAIITNIGGGKDVTKDVVISLGLSITTEMNSPSESKSTTRANFTKANTNNDNTIKNKKDNFFDNYPND